MSKIVFTVKQFLSIDNKFIKIFVHTTCLTKKKKKIIFSFKFVHSKLQNIFRRPSVR